MNAKHLDTLKRTVAALAVTHPNCEATIRTSDGRTITMLPDPMPATPEIVAHVKSFGDLPADKGMTTFGPWMDAHGVRPDKRYRAEFRKQAIVLAMRANYEAAQLDVDAAKAVAFIEEYAEIREELFNRPYSEDRAEWRMRMALNGWYAANAADLENAKLDGDKAEILKLAASLRAVLDRLDATERREANKSVDAEH